MERGIILIMGKSYHRAENAGVCRRPHPPVRGCFFDGRRRCCRESCGILLPLLFLSVRRALGSPCGLLLRAKHLFLAATPQNRVVFSINP